ncbi:MAG: NAD(P)H nitroreductase [Mycobacteriaceae bacterium]|nr:NAD(P)H nitroreductase [Mycobacteriaceae bacterium]
MQDESPDFAVIQNAVRLACRAPSLHNSQPWRWVAEPSALHLFADFTRVMNAADPEGREIYLSCGAALDHLTVAMAAFGWEAAVQRFPDPDDPLHVAAITFDSAPPGLAADSRPQALAIGRRYTDRRPYEAPADWARFEVLLRQIVIPHHVMFDTVLDNARPTLATVSRLTATIRANDPSYEAELNWWTSPFASGDGVPQSALLSVEAAGHIDAGRHFPAPYAAAPRAGHVEVDRSKIVVLSTHHEDARLDVLRCGEALSTVLLRCTASGLATCTLTHMTELAQSREIVRELTGQRGMPQLLIRIGYSRHADAAVAATPRRPLAEVLERRF